MRFNCPPPCAKCGHLHRGKCPRQPTLKQMQTELRKFLRSLARFEDESRKARLVVGRPRRTPEDRALDSAGLREGNKP